MRLFYIQFICYLIRFQSTHPRRVRLNQLMPFIARRDFNPHTREGCDHEAKNNIRFSIRFQSTHPRRVRPESGNCCCNIFQFQSTHPRRVRRSSKNFNCHIKISIHTPAKGATRRKMNRAAEMSNFNPHTREGCDLHFSKVKVM